MPRGSNSSQQPQNANNNSSNDIQLGRYFTGPHDLERHYDARHNVYLRPARIDLPIYIYLNKKGNVTKEFKTKKHRIKCEFNKDAFEGAIMQKFRKERIDISIDCFDVKYCKHEKDTGTSIYDFDLSDVDLEELAVIKVIQMRDPDISHSTSTAKESSTRNYNKARYDKENKDMEEADNTLRRALGPEGYDKLRKNNRLYTMAKFDLGVNKCGINEVRHMIYSELFPRKDAKNEDCVADVSMKEMMNMTKSMMMMFMMQNMASMQRQQPLPLPPVPPTPYTATHGQTTTTSTIRYDPKAAQPSNTNTITLPPIDFQDLQKKCEEYTASKNTTLPRKHWGQEHNHNHK